MIARADAVRVVAAFGLGAGRSSGPVSTLSPAEWSDLLARIRAERLTGPLVAAIDAGALRATEDQASAARTAHVEAMALCLRLERLLLDTVLLLERQSIDHRILKGPAVAHLDHPDPSLRSFVDIDLLVPSDRYGDASRALEGAGLARRFGEPRPGFDERFGKGGSFHTSEGLAVDLHRTLVFGPFGLTVDLADLWAQPQPLTLGGRQLRAMGEEARFLHACLHAIVGDVPPRLHSLRDVALLSPGPDSTGPLAMTERWRAGAVVTRAFEELRSRLGVDAGVTSARYATRVRSTALERRLLAVCVSPRASYASKTLAATMVVPGITDKAAFLRAMALPDRAYLSDRHRSHTRRWLSALTQVVRRRAPQGARARAGRIHRPG